MKNKTKRIKNTEKTGNTRTENTRSEIKTDWNLGLLYKGHDDPQIEKDIREAEEAYGVFARTYKGTSDYLKNEVKLAQALSDFESLLSERAIAKPILYFHFVLDLHSEDTVARAKMNQIQERLIKIEQSVLFFELALAGIPSVMQKKFLKSKKLSKYSYFLSVIFKRAAHNLSEPEEKIMGLKYMPSHYLWTTATEKIVATQTVEHEGKQIPLPEASSKIGDLPTTERRELYAKVIKVLEKIAPIAESEINAIVTNKKIDDELRGYTEPYDSVILSFQNDRKSVLALVDAVTRHFPISHRFFKLKARLLKLPHLEYSDRNVGIGENVKKVTFPEATLILKDLFGSIDPMYRNTLEGFLEKGHIDVYPKKGKTGGAYCHGGSNVPTFVLLNYTDTLDEVGTFAHEMGHAVHTELSKSQSALYQDYSTSTAEVASTLFEAFTFDALFAKLSPEEQIVALHNKINDDIQSIFRQIACFNFEVELHNTIRARGALSKEEICALMNKHMGAYLGPIVDMKDIDGNYFVHWGHIRRFFYVYAYAFGQLISKALYAEYKKDKTFIKKINQFLSAGGSDTPENIFKSIGIDVTEPDFWEKGLKSIEKDIEKLEKLTKNR